VRRRSLPEGDRRGLERRGKAGSALTRPTGQVGATIRVTISAVAKQPNHGQPRRRAEPLQEAAMGMEAARRADPSGAGEGGLDSAIGRPHDGDARETGGDMMGANGLCGLPSRQGDQVWRKRGRRLVDEESDFAFAPSWPRASGILDEDRDDGGPADAGTEKRPVLDGNDRRVVARAVWRKDLVVRIVVASRRDGLSATAPTPKAAQAILARGFSRESAAGDRVRQPEATSPLAARVKAGVKMG
jgi:hypothetical protein